MEHKVTIDMSNISKEIGYNEKAVNRYIELCLRKSCTLVRDDARKHHHFESRTGRLERAIEFMVYSKLKEGVVSINPQIASYGVYVHEPTGIYGPNGPYKIEPKYAKKLHFFWDRLGKWVTTSLVIHNGSPADRFLYESLNTNRAKINAIFKSNLYKLIKGGG
jgi:hypothetical protein